MLVQTMCRPAVVSNIYVQLSQTGPCLCAASTEQHGSSLFLVVLRCYSGKFLCANKPIKETFENLPVNDTILPWPQLEVSQTANDVY